MKMNSENMSTISMINFVFLNVFSVKNNYEKDHAKIYSPRKIKYTELYKIVITL